MTRFRFSAADRDGKERHGSVRAASREEAIAKISQSGLSVRRIAPVAVPAGSPAAVQPDQRTPSAGLGERGRASTKLPTSLVLGCIGLLLIVFLGGIVAKYQANTQSHTVTPAAESAIDMREAIKGSWVNEQFPGWRYSFFDFDCDMTMPGRPEALRAYYKWVDGRTISIYYEPADEAERLQLTFLTKDRIWYFDTTHSIRGTLVRFH